MGCSYESHEFADVYIFPYGLVVRIPAFHAGGPGSIPGVGANILHKPHQIIIKMTAETNK